MNVFYLPFLFVRPLMDFLKTSKGWIPLEHWSWGKKVCEKLNGMIGIF